MKGTVAELFAGIGGFRLALEGHPPIGLAPTGWSVVWSDQWEPSTKAQHASDCYVAHFGPEGHLNEDIASILDRVERGEARLPDVDLVVGGFPCQDYSVARLLTQAAGIQGKKGVLWWQIHRFLRIARPRFVLLENVDRLLRSPAQQRGRDFGVMLRCLADLGYAVEWRVVNAADYGFAQRRRRVFLVARLDPLTADPVDLALRAGVLARAVPATLIDEPIDAPVMLPTDLVELSDRFAFEFRNAGVMRDGVVWTWKVAPRYDGARVALADVLEDEEGIPREYFIPRAQLKDWSYLKGAKREPRTSPRTGYEYLYSEGALPFPDPLDQPSRTVLTAEGGSSPSRSKHVVRTLSGRFRRLTPLELERLDGFPDGWTATGMSDRQRAFCLGNAIVVGLVHRIARELAADAGVAIEGALAAAAQ